MIDIEATYAICYNYKKKIKIELYENEGAAIARYIDLAMHHDYVQFWNMDTGEIQSTICPFKDVQIRENPHQDYLFHLD